MQLHLDTHTFTINYSYVTGPGKTGFIYTKHVHISLCQEIHLLFCMWYSNSISFIEFVVDFCTYDDILDTIQITDKIYYILNSQNQVKFYMQQPSNIMPRVHACIQMCIHCLTIQLVKRMHCGGEPELVSQLYNNSIIM